MTDRPATAADVGAAEMRAVVPKAVVIVLGGRL